MATTVRLRMTLFVKSGCILFVHVALVLIKLGVLFGKAVQRQPYRPWPGKHLWILDGRFVDQSVRRCLGITLDDMHRVAVEVTGGVQPGFGIVVRYVDNERIPDPFAA